MADPSVKREKARQELIYWQESKAYEEESEDKKQAGLSTVRIKHEMLEAVKKERELEQKHEKLEIEEPKEEKKEEVVPLVLVSGRWRRKKKKRN